MKYLFNLFDYWGTVVTSRDTVKTLKDLEGKELAGARSTTNYQMYEFFAKRQGVEGQVELSVMIDEKGQVVDAQVVRGAGGKAGLNEAAIDNVKKRKYRPATKDGVPVKVWVSVMVNFQLPR